MGTRWHQSESRAACCQYACLVLACAVRGAVRGVAWRVARRTTHAYEWYVWDQPSVSLVALHERRCLRLTCLFPALLSRRLLVTAPCKRTVSTMMPKPTVSPKQSWTRSSRCPTRASSPACHPPASARSGALRACRAPCVRRVAAAPSVRTADPSAPLHGHTCTCTQ